MDKETKAAVELLTDLMWSVSSEIDTLPWAEGGDVALRAAENAVRRARHAMIRNGGEDRHYHLALRNAKAVRGALRGFWGKE